jgi:hypothetical protein
MVEHRENTTACLNNYEIENTESFVRTIGIRGGVLEVRAGSRNGHSTNRSDCERDLLHAPAEGRTKRNAKRGERQSRKPAPARATLGMNLQLGASFRLELVRAQLPCSDALRRDGSTLEAMRMLRSQMPAPGIPPARAAAPNWRAAYASGSRTTSIQQRSGFPVLSSQKGLRAPTLLVSTSLTVVPVRHTDQ